MYLSTSSVRVGGTTRRKDPRSTGRRCTRILFLRMTEVHEEMTSQTPVLCFRARRHKRTSCRAQDQIRDRAHCRVDVGRRLQ